MRDIVEAIHRAKYLYLASHIAPDGDTLGSVLGLHWALAKLGKGCRPACADPLPDIYKFLPGSDLFSSQPPSKGELIVSIDASDLARLGGLYVPEIFRKATVINIDHHITNERFGDLNLVDPKSSATAQVILRLIRRLGVPLDEHMAMCLLTGLADDTQCFRTSSTTPRSLTDGAELMLAGADLADIVDRIFNTRTVPGLALWGEILRTLRLEDGIVWAWETGQIREDVGGVPLEESRGIVNLLAGVREAEMAILFKDGGDNLVEVSMRSVPGVDVSTVALHFGGGGHPRAAGCRVSGTPREVEGAVLAQARKVLAEARASEREPAPKV
jgi:phosphoesterase RecJ-like protein